MHINWFHFVFFPPDLPSSLSSFLSSLSPSTIFHLSFPLIFFFLCSYLYIHHSATDQPTCLGYCCSMAATIHISTNSCHRSLIPSTVLSSLPLLVEVALCNFFCTLMLICSSLATAYFQNLFLCLLVKIWFSVHWAIFPLDCLFLVKMWELSVYYRH